MRISELVKTYRWLNDPAVPPWSIRFVGGFFLVALVAAGVTGLYLFTATEDAAPAAAVSPGEVREAYVGIQPGPAVIDSAPAEAALAAWKAQHPHVRIVSEEPVRAESGAIAGYRVRYLA